MQKRINKRELSGETLKKWVKNLSQYKSYPSEWNILTKGVNFAISPAKIPFQEYIA